MNKKVLLIIMDGWGYAPSWGGNAVETAETPNIDIFWRKYPHTTLLAAQEAVGLPRHEPGNSEVGHLNLGCGQIVQQNLPGITKFIQDKSFFSNKVLIDGIESAKKNQSNIHIMGLLSNGGVHSHIDHLFALLELIKQQNFNRVFIHVFTDGRDTDQMEAYTFLAKLEKYIKDLQIGQIDSIAGRFYAMDRDNRWERIQQAYDCITSGIGLQKDSAEKAIAESYRQGKYDEFITPTVILSETKPFTPVKDNDTVIFFNFRSDRTRELTHAFVDNSFKGFHRRKTLKNLYFASFSYNEEYENRIPVKTVFRLQNTSHPIANVLDQNKFKQFHLAETEKYAHVTYFFNGGKEEPFKLEERMMIPSPKVTTYDLKPQMSAYEITRTLVRRLGSYNFIVVNFANADMVGHTGNLKAAIKACEVVDDCVGQAVKSALSHQFEIIITADHGNAEEMINPDTGEPDTEHSTNPVPFILVSNDPHLQNPLKLDFNNPAKLSDVAPTIIKILNLTPPNEMTGHSLI